MKAIEKAFTQDVEVVAIFLGSSDFFAAAPSSKTPIVLRIWGVEPRPSSPRTRFNRPIPVSLAG